MSNLTSISSAALYAAFIMYLIATIFFGGTIKEKKETETNKKQIAGTIGISLTLVGFLSQLLYFITRWVAGGHAPVSNMFEFVTFLGMCLVFGFTIVYFIFQLGVLGLFALPIALLIIAYASMFPQDISPLIPSLQSNWLFIHVMTVSLAQGILAISFVAGFIYLILKVNQTKRTKKNTWLEIIMYMLVISLGFVITTTIFNAIGYEAVFQDANDTEMEYQIPAIAGPEGATLVNTEKMSPWFDAPGWLLGDEAAKKLNTLIWSLATGTLLYFFLRLLTKKRIGAAVQPFLKKFSPQLLDEVMYRSVTIGFPIFTLGGLIFAAIWAQ